MPKNRILIVKGESPNCVTPSYISLWTALQLSFHQTETNKLCNNPKKTLWLEDFNFFKHSHEKKGICWAEKILGLTYIK